MLVRHVGYMQINWKSSISDFCGCLVSVKLRVSDTSRVEYLELSNVSTTLQMPSGLMFAETSDN
jgi:hypothetical protein